jgi:hypothetical protein
MTYFLLFVCAVVTLAVVYGIWENMDAPQEKKFALMGCVFAWPISLPIFAVFCMIVAIRYFEKELSS